MDFKTVVISGVLGAIGGLIAGSGKPLVDWHIEKKRDVRRKHDKLIQAWHRAIQRELDDGEEFVESREYIELRPYLTPDEIRELEQNTNSITIIASAKGLSADHELKLISDAVDCLAKKWKIH